MATLVTTLSAMITGTLLGEESAQDVAGYFAGTSFYGSGGVLIPGCEIWQDVSATSNPHNPEEVVITARIVAHYKVPTNNGNGYAGELITPEFVHDYILGAGDCLIGSGDIFSPDSVLVVVTTD
jgi:hypothetical protein